MTDPGVPVERRGVLTAPAATGMSDVYRVDAAGCHRDDHGAN